MNQLSPSFIPAGLVGEVRRTAAGARLQIDHHHEELEFDLVVKGAGSYTLGERNYLLKPGTLIWLVPGQQHRLVRSPGLEMWVVSLRPELIDPGQIAALRAQPLCLLPGHELIDLDRLLSQVAQDSDEPPVYNAGITYIALRALRASRTSPAAETRALHAAVARALLLLREQGAAQSLSELARAAGVTAPYLSRLLIEYTGRSFVDWRNRVRLDRFMASFQPGTNLLAAALDAGFGSYARFHHVFHDLIGCTPSDWMRQADTTGGRTAQSYGVPSAGMLSTRQRWTRLLPHVDPAVHAVFGHAFVDRLLREDPQSASRHAPPFTGLDAGLPPAACDRLVASLRQRDPVLADDLAALIGSHDFAGTAAAVLQVFGLSSSSLIDAAAGLLLVLWVAANRRPDPARAQVEAVVRQLAGALAPTLRRLDATTAQQAQDALLCHFVIGYHALRSARASGDPRALDRLAEAAMAGGRAAFGGELTRLALSSRGYARRE